MSSWWRSLRSDLAPPAVLPDLLADHAGHPRLLVGHRNHPAFGRSPGDFEQKLGADCFLELVAVLDRDHEGTGTADHAVLVIEIEIVDVHGLSSRLLHPDRHPAT